MLLSTFSHPPSASLSLFTKAIRTPPSTATNPIEYPNPAEIEGVELQEVNSA